MGKRDSTQKKKERRTAAPRGIAPARTKVLWVPALIALATALTYAPAINNGFTKWDDPIYVTDNYQIRDLSFSGIKTDFGTFLEGNYQPLTATSFALDYHFWRLDPKGYHITNVVLHVLNTLAVFVLIFLLTGSTELSAITSLFFGVHPLHVESVAWVSGRKDVLYALFYIGACISYVLWLRTDRLKATYYVGALGLFLLSVLSKGMAVTLPLALILIDFYSRRRATVKRLLLEKAPFFLLSLVFGLLAVVAQKGKGAIGDLAAFPFYERALFACYGFLAYLFKALVPVNLSTFYPYPDNTGGGLPPVFWIAPILVILIAAGVYRSLRHGRGVMFGALFYSVNVALVLQLIPVGRAIMADRYTYLSYIGVGFALALGYRYLIQGPLASRRGLRGAGTAVLCMFGAMLMLTARARCEVWKDNVSLWTDVIGKYPRAGLAYTNRAKTYKERGEYEPAMADLERALFLNPNDAGALVNRGNLFYLMHNRERALADLDRAISLDSTMADAWNSRGAVRSGLMRFEEGLADFNKAIELNRVFPGAYLNRANTLTVMKRYDEAMAGYNAYISWEPGDGRGYFCRSLARFNVRDTTGALHDASQAQALGYPIEPGYLEILRKTVR
jgi:protein O-mannosyl-transferase